MVPTSAFPNSCAIIVIIQSWYEGGTRPFAPPPGTVSCDNWIRSVRYMSFQALRDYSRFIKDAFPILFIHGLVSNCLSTFTRDSPRSCLIVTSFDFLITKKISWRTACANLGFIKPSGEPTVHTKTKNL